MIPNIKIDKFLKRKLVEMIKLWLWQLINNCFVECLNINYLNKINEKSFIVV